MYFTRSIHKNYTFKASKKWTMSSLMLKLLPLGQMASSLMSTIYNNIDDRQVTQLFKVLVYIDVSSLLSIKGYSQLSDK